MRGSGNDSPVVFWALNELGRIELADVTTRQYEFGWSVFSACQRLTMPSRCGIQRLVEITANF